MKKKREVSFELSLVSLRIQHESRTPVRPRGDYVEPRTRVSVEAKSRDHCVERRDPKGRESARSEEITTDASLPSLLQFSKPNLKSAEDTSTHSRAL